MEMTADFSFLEVCQKIDMNPTRNWALNTVTNFSSITASDPDIAVKQEKIGKYSISVFHPPTLLFLSFFVFTWIFKLITFLLITFMLDMKLLLHHLGKRQSGSIVLKTNPMLK